MNTSWRDLVVLLAGLAAAILSGPGGRALAQEDVEALEKGPLRAAIFVQNRAGAAFKDRIDELNDLITTRLTEKGFTVMDRNDVIAKFREARDSEKIEQQALKFVNDVINLDKTESVVEDSVSGASALRVSQMLDANYLIFASLTSIGSETHTFKGDGTIYKTSNETTTVTLRVSLKVLEGNSGGTVYGDVVAVSERIATNAFSEVASTEVVSRLLDKGALQIADRIESKMERIRNVRPKTAQAVEFTISSNVEGASVELDGAVIGTAPSTFNAAPGLHQVRLSKENYATWERTVNIFPGQILNVSLEMSEEGLRRHREKQDVELTKRERETEMDIAKEQSKAEAQSEVLVAEGEKTKRENSYVKFKGEVDTLVTDHDSELNIGK